MADLIAPHGGLSEPVCRTVGEQEREAFLAEAAALVKVPVSSADLSSVYRFGDGTLSPLTGPMNSAIYNQVLDECYVISHGQKYAWTIPIAFPITAEMAKTLGQPVLVENRPGNAGATGADIVAKSAPDGLTWLMSYSGTHAINPALYGKMPFDPKKDLAPLASLATLPFDC